MVAQDPSIKETAISAFIASSIRTVQLMEMIVPNMSVNNNLLSEALQLWQETNSNQCPSKLREPALLRRQSLRACGHVRVRWALPA